MYLAPRPSITVSESSDFEQLVQADQACGGCTLETDREFVFKLYLNGGGSLDTAWSLHARIMAQLEQACDEEVLLQRRVQDESWLVYRVKMPSTLRVTDVQTQYGCDRILTVELKLTLEAAVENQRTPAPIVMNISFPRPTISVATSITPTPIASTISFPAPSISMSISPSPLVVDIGFPTFNRDLGGVDVTAGTASFAYNYAKQKLWTGQIDLDTDDIRILLVMTSTTADTNTDALTISGFTTLDEFNGAGYARQALTNEAVNADVANARAEFDADDCAFGALSNGTRQITGLVMYKFVVDDTQSIPIAYMNFTNFNPGGGALTLEWNAEGIMWQT